MSENRVETTKAKLFSPTARIKSFYYAFAGIATLLREQHNAWIHALATLAVVLAAFIFDVSVRDWISLLIVITLVWVAEGFNSSIEYLCDVVSPEFHPLVKKAKDVAAGAVLLAAIGAALIGALVFWPYFFA